MKQIQILKNETIAGVKITVIKGQSVSYTIPRIFSGMAFQEWKEENKQAIDDFIISVDPSLLHKTAHEKKHKTAKSAKISDYQNSKEMSKRLQL